MNPDIYNHKLNEIAVIIRNLKEIDKRDQRKGINEIRQALYKLVVEVGDEGSRAITQIDSKSD